MALPELRFAARRARAISAGQCLRRNPGKPTFCPRARPQRGNALKSRFGFSASARRHEQHGQCRAGAPMLRSDLFRSRSIFRECDPTLDTGIGDVSVGFNEA
jgi:hypothetical protein